MCKFNCLWVRMVDLLAPSSLVAVSLSLDSTVPASVSSALFADAVKTIS